MPSYDASGDILQDANSQYVYDAEGRICAVYDDLTHVMMGYLYDAEGNRIAKGTITALNCNTAQNGFTLTESYILGPGGQQLTEVSRSGGVAQWAHTNTWAAGLLVATDWPDQGQHVLDFELEDWLGTRRILANSNGGIEETCHSLPYGAGEDCAPTPTEHLFTQHERDAETGNDYFGARYYASSMGRFLSPDPTGLYYADPTNPQSLNLYAYAENNPLTNVDPDGLRCVWDDGSFDSEDDPQTGNEKDCEKQGGSWYDPGTYAPGVDWASSNSDGTLTLHGVQGSANSVSVTGTATGAVADTSLWASGYLADVGIAYANATNYITGDQDIAYYRFFMTHYCGPGGAGDPTGVMDRACKAHDKCYADAGLDASVNTSTSTNLTLQQAVAAQACNQALYNAARSNPKASGSSLLRLWLTKGDKTPFRGHILAPGTEAKQW